MAVGGGMMRRSSFYLEIVGKADVMFPVLSSGRCPRGLPFFHPAVWCSWDFPGIRHENGGDCFGCKWCTLFWLPSASKDTQLLWSQCVPRCRHMSASGISTQRLYFEAFCSLMVSFLCFRYLSPQSLYVCTKAVVPSSAASNRVARCDILRGNTSRGSDVPATSDHRMRHLRCPGVSAVELPALHLFLLSSAVPGRPITGVGRVIPYCTQSNRGTPKLRHLPQRRYLQVSARLHRVGLMSYSPFALFAALGFRRPAMLQRCQPLSLKCPKRSGRHFLRSDGGKKSFGHMKSGILKKIIA